MPGLSDVRIARHNDAAQADTPRAQHTRPACSCACHNGWIARPSALAHDCPQAMGRGTARRRRRRQEWERRLAEKDALLKEVLHRCVAGPHAALRGAKACCATRQLPRVGDAV